MAKRNNFYSRKKEIEGVVYTAQFNGISEFLRMLDECKDTNGNINSFELGEYVCDNIIVDPKITVKDFDDIETYNKVLKWALQVAQGKFRDEIEISTQETSN